MSTSRTSHAVSTMNPNSVSPASVDTVTILSKWTVYPDCKSTLGELQLSIPELPLLSCHYNQKGLFFRPPSSPLASLVPLLTSSLSRALSLFPPLAGRLSTLPDGRIVITCNGAGAEFSFAVAPSLSLVGLLSPHSDVPPAVRSFFPLNGVNNFHGHSHPLAAFQLTELGDGAVFLGAAVNHSVVDGTSFWNFFNSWAELCRGGIPVAVPPDLCRNFFSDSKAVLRFPGGAPEVMFTVDTSVRERFFHFSRKTISELKSRANCRAIGGVAAGNSTAEVYEKQTHDSKAMSVNEGGEISSFQSLCALIWQSVTRARKQLSPGAVTTFQMAVNCRQRVVPPIAPNYFGNAIQAITTHAVVRDVVTRDLPWVAGLLHYSVVSHDNEMIRRIVAEWEAAPRCISPGIIDGASLIIGSSPRFPIYEGNDFGWGLPVAVRSGPANKFDGKIAAFPGRKGDGSVELELCLTPETMAALLCDDVFMSYVDV